MKKLTKILLSCLLSLTCIHQLAFNEVNATENQLGNIDTRSATGSELEPIKVGDFEYAYYAMGKQNKATLMSYLGTDNEITIPEKINGREIEYLHSDAFSEADTLEKINVSPNNKYFSSVDGILYNKDKTVLIKVPNRYSKTKFVIPETVIHINSTAFSGCRNIETIEIPENHSNYSSIDGVLLNKDKTELIKVPDNYQKKEYFVPNGVKVIYPSAFEYCKQLTNITISDSVIEIRSDYPRYYTGTSAFSKCPNLKNINVAENNPVYSSIDGVLYNKAKDQLIRVPIGYGKETYDFPMDLKRICSRAFADCGSLKYLTLPEGNLHISYEAFYNCKNLETINFPDDFGRLDNLYDIISGCTSLRNLNASKNSKNYSSIDGILYNKTKTALELFPLGYDKTTYTMPEGVVGVDDRLSLNCLSLTEVNLPDSLTYLGIWNNLFLQCPNLKSINVSENNSTFSSEKGVLFNKDKTKLIKVPSDYADKKYITPNSVTEIEDNAFKEYTNLEEVVLPDNLSKLNSSSFENCINLKNITIPEGIAEIGLDVFRGCTNLTNVVLPSSLEKIIGQVFSWCYSLEKIYIPENVSYIGDESFYGTDCVLYVQPDSYAMQYAIDRNTPYKIMRDITSISLDNKSLTMNVNESKKLVASIDPTYSGFEKDLIWTTSNANVATVDENGVVTAHANGDASITVSTVNGLTATCTIKVFQNLVKRGWVFENDSWYFYENGVKKTGWLMDSNTWYLLSNTGEMLTGWQSVNGTWYYMDENGKMQTGWQLVNGTWYFMDENGKMQTGWLHNGGNWYLLSDSGKMQTGWQLVNGTWYYMSDNGIMETGWLYNGGNWYLLSDSGKMLTGWQLVNGTWYYMSDNGIMETGWLYYGGNWYLLSDSGKMLTGWQLAGGAWYYLDSNGVWVE